MWSQTKKALKALWAGSIRDRVDIHSTSYRTNDAGHGRAWITVDGEQWLEIRDCDHCAALMKLRQRARIGSPSVNEGDYLGKADLYKAITAYLSASIDELFNSPQDALTHVLLALDRRLGKRRLEALDWAQIPELARPFFELRCAAEGVRVVKAAEG